MQRAKEHELQSREMGQSPDIQLSSLVGAQKKWIAYRYANCTFEDERVFGGTSIGGNYSACLCALSLERAEALARIRKHVLRRVRYGAFRPRWGQLETL
jgi:uncharacterized protein YecT (DUF1311 family)